MDTLILNTMDTLPCSFNLSICTNAVLCFRMESSVSRLVDITYFLNSIGMKLTTATEKEKSPSPTSSVCPSSGKFILKLHVEKLHGQRLKNYNELIRHQGANWDIHAFIWNFLFDFAVILPISTNWFWYWILLVVKHIMMLHVPIKTITSVLKVYTYIITSITARPVGFIAILVIMSVSPFKTDTILYIYLITIKKEECLN